MRDFIRDHRAVLALAAPHVRHVDALLASPAVRAHVANTRRIAAMACQLLQAQPPTNFGEALAEAVRSRR